MSVSSLIIDRSPAQAGRLPSSSDAGTQPVPRTSARVAAAMAIGALASLLAWYCAHRPGANSDFALSWRGAQALLAGQDPYRVLAGGLPAPFEEPLYYPLTTLLISAPVASLALPLAAALVLGTAMALLAFALTRSGWWRLYVIAGAPALVALAVGQWSPLIAAAALLPAAGFLLLAKPNLGLACYLARPTWRATAGCCALLALSLMIEPGWPLAWLRHVSRLQQHPAPAFTLWGAPLWLLVFRWRRWDARLVLAMGCVPQLLFFADQLPLLLVARERLEAARLSSISLLAFLLWFATADRALPYVPQAGPWVMAGLYLPAMVVVLRRPNVGHVPLWVETLVARVPWWLAGTPVRRSENPGG